MIPNKRSPLDWVKSSFFLSVWTCWLQWKPCQNLPACWRSFYSKIDYGGLSPGMNSCLHKSIGLETADCFFFSFSVVSFMFYWDPNCICEERFGKFHVSQVLRSCPEKNDRSRNYDRLQRKDVNIHFLWYLYLCAVQKAEKLRTSNK